MDENGRSNPKIPQHWWNSSLIGLLWLDSGRIRPSLWTAPAKLVGGLLMKVLHHLSAEILKLIPQDVITSATVGWWFGLQDSKKDSQRVSICVIWLKWKHLQKNHQTKHHQRNPNSWMLQQKIDPNIILLLCVALCGRECSMPSSSARDQCLCNVTRPGND